MLSLKRIFKAGWEKFRRDKSSTSAALVVMVVVLMVVSFLFFLQGFSKYAVTSIKESIDISTYLKDGVSDEEVLALRQELLSIPEVENVEYITKERAMEFFVKKHEGDSLILDSLAAVGQNPLLASLNIRTKEPDQYEMVAEYLEDSQYSSAIDSIDYHDRAPVIVKLGKLMSGIKWGVVGISAVLSFVALLVSFNTVRLAIYNSKDEIEVMRLVGAGNWFIRGPFLVQGIIVGLFATFFTFLLLLPLLFFLSIRFQTLSSEFDVLSYFFANLLWLLLLLVGVGMGLGLASSFIATKRYLRI